MRLAKKYVTETKPLVEVMGRSPPAFDVSTLAYSSRELAGRTFYRESKERVRVQLPNGYVQFKKGNFFVPDSCELRLSLAEDGVEDYFSEIEKLRTRADSFVYDIPSSEIWMTRHTQDDKGELVYTIRVKQTDVGYRLVPEIPHIGNSRTLLTASLTRQETGLSRHFCSTAFLQKKQKQASACSTTQQQTSVLMK